MLGQALTENLSPDNRLAALRRLLTTWERMVHLTLDQKALIAECRELIKWIAQNKAKRNRIAHWIWLRSTDAELFGWKHHIMPTDDKERPNETINKSDILEFSREIGQIAGRVAAAELQARMLPPFPKSSPGMLNVPGLASLLGPYLHREEP